MSPDVHNWLVGWAKSSRYGDRVVSKGAPSYFQRRIEYELLKFAKISDHASLHGNPVAVSSCPQLQRGRQAWQARLEKIASLDKLCIDRYATAEPAQLWDPRRFNMHGISVSFSFLSFRVLLVELVGHAEDGQVATGYLLGVLTLQSFCDEIVACADKDEFLPLKGEEQCQFVYMATIGFGSSTSLRLP